MFDGALDGLEAGVTVELVTCGHGFCEVPVIPIEDETRD
jgi:hypothetical protein